ncbi:GDSL-type esterase/lipase family protein [Actinosynnema sp. NPDC023794]
MSSGKRAIIALCAVLVGVLGVAGAVGYLAFVRPPVNPPAEACGGEGVPGSGPVVVAAGASTTRGTLGADWVGALRDRGHRLVNAGVNGHTTADLLARVDADVVACRPDAVTLLIGTNDVRGDVPLDEYRADLGAIVARVRSGTTARIALLSLPPLGEDLDGALNVELRDYNAVVEEIATEAGVSYLPLHERMVDALRERDDEPTPFGFDFGVAYLAAAEHHLLGHEWDEVARGNGLRLLVDHVHLSDRGGAIVADLVDGWLSTPDSGR